MSRRNRRSGICLEKTQDPGKDLFAYLFLLIMVFSFMLVMSTEQRMNEITGQAGPRPMETRGHSSLASVSPEKIGRLSKKDGQLFLIFGNESYHTVRDIGRLERDNRISAIKDGEGVENRMLYLEEARTGRILLAEYLSAFQSLSAKGIGVAFAERVK